MNRVAATWQHRQLRCSEAVHARLFDEELVILDLAKGEYYALDRVGACLWSGLQAGRSIDAIAREIVAEYDVTFERALDDLVALGDDLVAKGLMVQDAPATSRDDRG